MTRHPRPLAAMTSVLLALTSTAGATALKTSAAVKAAIPTLPLAASAAGSTAASAATAVAATAAPVAAAQAAPASAPKLEAASERPAISEGKPALQSLAAVSERAGAFDNAVLRSEDPAAVATPLKKWRCVICGYEYDEAVGDPDGGVAPGTRWQDVPEDWVCPKCAVGKADFEMVEVK